MTVSPKVCEDISVAMLTLLYTVDLVEHFRARLEDRPEGRSDAVAAIETLMDLIRSSKGKCEVKTAVAINNIDLCNIQLAPSLVFKMRSKLLLKL